FRDPADAADRRLVPFLEIDARMPRQRGASRAHARDVRLECTCVRLSLVARADQRTQAAYVIDDAVHRAMVADPHFDAGLHQFARDVGLDVGEPDRHVGLQREDLVDVRAGEGRNLRLLLARALRTHGESGNADDAVLFAEGVQDLGWFFREANDPSRPTHHGYS